MSITRPNFEYLFRLHRDEPAVVIGNGPSLNSVPQEFLDRFATFGSNRVYLKYVPNFYAAVNPLVIAQWRYEIEELNSMKFLSAGSGIRDSYPLYSAPFPAFSYDPTRWIYEGYTVTFVLLQLAFYMGFHTIYLVGVDHRYVYTGDPNEASRMEGEDPNHFDANYFRGAVWNNPDLAQSERAYVLARVAYEAVGGRIINLTPNTTLEVFETGALEDYQ